MAEKRFQISLLSMLLVVTAFAIGFVSRNIADGLSPFYVGLSVPASNAPVRTGDSLLIESMVDPSINRNVTVLADGKISLPLVGFVDVKGQTTTQIQQTLNKKYGAFLKSPSIEVFRAESSRTTN